MQIRIAALTRQALEEQIIDRPYAPEIIAQYDWAGFYPVVSGRIIIDVFDCARPHEHEQYRNKPIVNDEYIDADAPDEEQ